MQKAEKRFGAIFRKVKSSGIPGDQLGKLEIIAKLYPQESANSKTALWRNGGVAVCVAVFLAAIASIWSFNIEPECFLETFVHTNDFFREPEDCSICLDVDRVDRVKNISMEDFEKNYSIPNRPVVVTDGTRGWAALEAFSFDFFKELYYQRKNDKIGCQFFPYNTGVETLAEALAMRPERARLEPGEEPWYLGWFNCNDEAGKILKGYYDKPYFLPETSENMARHWIFMGAPGNGAPMHVDNVSYPSWQAQVRGKKIWKLAPPPECLYQCKSFEVVMEPGDVLVVDTNRWYHQTNVLPGDVSITIGSEFD